MSAQNASIGIYGVMTEVEAVIRRFQKSGFDLSKVSILACDVRSESRTVGYYLSNGHLNYWGTRCGFWDKIWSMLPEWAFLEVPDLGPVLMAGPLASWAVAALRNENIFPQLNAIEAALYSIGLSPGARRQCENALKNGRFVVLACGTAEEVARARNVLGNTLEFALR